jgi:hypothetical protein
LDSANAKFLKINYTEILDELKKYAASKGRSHGTKTIVLVGSLAKGTYTGASDADVLIIADDVPTRPLDRYALFADATLKVDLEPRVYKTTEFLSKIKERDRFAIESLKIGIPLFGARFFNNLKTQSPTV